MEDQDTWKTRRDAMYEAAKEPKTTADLSKFVESLRNEEHDYNSIVHACAAAALAACRVVDRGPHGGITGFQAGAIFWEFWGQWLASEEERECGARLLTWSQALYPQYADKFSAPTIPASTWSALQEGARRRLEQERDNEHVSPQVRAHWGSVANGRPPFGLQVDPTP